MEPDHEKAGRDIYSRVVAVLQGEKPDRLPFIDRMELWYSSHVRAGTLPGEFKASAADIDSSALSPFTVPLSAGSEGMALTDVHREVGMGQQKMMTIYSMRLSGVEMISRLDGEVFYHEVDPVIDYFPRLYGVVQADKPGVTTTEFITPVGKLTVQHQVVPEMIEAGALPYMQEHPVKNSSDYRALEYVLEHTEYLPQFDRYHEEQAALGEIGFVVPFLDRVPFQKLLLDYVGEVPLFYMLYDEPQLMDTMMTLLDEQYLETIHLLDDFAGPYIEFPDNLDGVMTNPRLFEKYSLPYYQRYSDILHNKGMKVGSHTDGNVKPILTLLAESGLDVCESFTPMPVTECTFEEAWRAWRNGPTIWGGIPSPILETRTSEPAFKEFVEDLLTVVGDGSLILGVGDMVMSNSLIDRVRYIADRVEEHTLAT